MCWNIHHKYVNETVAAMVWQEIANSLCGWMASVVPGLWEGDVAVAHTIITRVGNILYMVAAIKTNKQGRKPIATFPFTFVFMFTFARLSGRDWISTRVDGRVLCYYYFIIIIIINIDMCGQILTTQPCATGLELDWSKTRKKLAIWYYWSGCCNCLHSWTRIFRFFWRNLAPLRWLWKF